ncbi:hypothetical protein [Nocardia beijingensis]
MDVPPRGNYTPPFGKSRNQRREAELPVDCQAGLSCFWSGYDIIGSMGIGMFGNMLFHMSRIIPII